MMVFFAIEIETTCHYCLIEIIILFIQFISVIKRLKKKMCISNIDSSFLQNLPLESTIKIPQHMVVVYMASPQCRLYKVKSSLLCGYFGTTFLHGYRCKQLIKLILHSMS